MKSFTRNALLGAAGFVAVSLPVQAMSTMAGEDSHLSNLTLTASIQMAQRDENPGGAGNFRNENPGGAGNFRDENPGGAGNFRNENPGGAGNFRNENPGGAGNPK
jgi:hypothetical protein